MNNNTTIQLPFTTSHAFIIGIDDYQHVSPLSTAANDARKIAEQLANLHHFQVHPPLLNATHKDMRKLLSETIPQLVGEDDRVLFYFAGHGIALDGEEGPNGYLVAADTRPGKEDTLVSMQALHDALTTLPCRHGLLILDCCFSGAFKWSSGFRDVIFDMPKVIYEERFWRYCKDPAWQVITSAAHDQKAVDIITNQSLGLRDEAVGEHSPFAHSLMQALDGAGDVVPAGAGDGVITATELYSYLRDSVEMTTQENAKRQSPSIFNLQRHDKGEFIFLNPNHRFNLPPTPDRNPFMGLSSYNEDDANLFYGRDRTVTALLEKVKKQALTVVSGASGTGKSSVIKAGVLPQLRQQGYTILPIIRPGKEPMQTIATELLGQEKSTIAPSGKNQEVGEPVLPLSPPPKGDLSLGEGQTVLVIDQYEELITQCLDPDERVAFEQQIANWLNQYPDLRIMLSIRSDFEPQFESEVLAQWWQAGRYVVPSFSLEEIREIITKPAAQAVLFYEPEDLVEQLSEEVSQAPGALPLLSFTLSELYHKYLKSGREDRGLTEADYLELGGVIGALRTRADAEYKALQPDEQSSMRKLMLRMVSLEGGELAGKRVYSEELQFSDSKETQRLQTIANQLVDARLLLKGIDGQGRSYIEPAHDALVRAWARLWEWIKTVGEEKIALQYKLSQAVNDYHSLLSDEPKKARNLLWNSNPRLDLLEAELVGKDHHLNAQEEAFVRKSVKRRAQRKRTNWTIAIAVMIGLALLAAYAFVQRNTAIKNGEEAIANLDTARKNEAQAKINELASKSATALQTDNTVAFRLAEEALNSNPFYRESIDHEAATGALWSAFYTTIFENKTGMMYSPVSNMPYVRAERDYLTQELSASDSLPVPADVVGLGGSPVQSFYSKSRKYYLRVKDLYYGDLFVEIVDLQTQQSSRLPFYETERLFSPHSFNPQEDLVIIPLQNKLQFFHPLNLLQAVFELKAPSSVRQAYFAEDGKQVYAETFDGKMYRWNLEGYKIPTLGGAANRDRELDGIYLEPNGRKIVLAFDEQTDIEVWEWDNDWFIEGSTDIQRLSMEDGGKTLKWPSGRDINLSAYTYFENRSHDGYSEFPNLPPPSQYGLTYPENRRTITIEQLQGDRQEARLVGHTHPIQSIVVSPDGSMILTSSNHEIKLWNWAGNNFFSMPRGGYGGFVPDGKSIFLIPWSKEEEEGFAPRNTVEIYALDPAGLSLWANNNDIYRLSTADKKKFNVE